MTVEGELDDISGSGQTRAAQDMCTGVSASDRLHLEVPGAGHYGIFSGSRWRTIVYPQVVNFIKGHAAPAAKAVVKAAPVQATPVKAEAVKTAPVVQAKVEAAKPAAPKAPTKATAKPAAKAPVKAAASSKAKVVAKPAAKASTPAVKTSWVEPKKKA
jgi:poly(3-hydroxybutyrate) depolymerase